jgi:hypothetical protein
MDPPFEEILEGLARGDFSRLDPIFAADPSPIVAWCEEGRFDGHPEGLAEALSCACFNGRTAIAAFLMDREVDPTAGDKTGLDAFHWAVNRGQLDAVRLLISRGAKLQSLNRYGGTVLGCAKWSQEFEPRPDHPAIIQALIDAGAT